MRIVVHVFLALSMRGLPPRLFISPTMAMHVAFVAFPFGSHPAALFSLTAAVAAASTGATFTFIGTTRSLASVANAAAALGNVSLCAIADGCPSPPLTNIEKQIGLFLRATPGNIRDGLAAAAEEAGAAVNCIVSDAFMWTVREVAEEMGVPWVAMWPGGTPSLSAHLNTDLLRQTLGVGDELSTKADQTLDFIPGLSAMRVSDLPEGVVSGDLDSGFPTLLHRMSKELPKATAVVVNTIEGLDPAIDANFITDFKTYLPVGPTNLLRPQTMKVVDTEFCLPWLDRQSPASVAYISFGMIMSLPPAELAALAEALETSGIPFLWSLKEGLREHLPVGFIERTKLRQGLVVSWAPQVQVLAHPAVGAFVTHCGWNSVMESISSGVPMVCRPLFGDHMMAERMVSQVLGIGVGFKDGTVTVATAASSLNLVLGEVEGRKIRERIMKLKTMAMEAIGPDGSSTKNLSKLLKILGRQEG